jgi:class 3 adenylate cyclase
VNGALVANGEKFDIEIVNFHFRGACIKVAPNDYRFQSKNAHLIIKIGLKELPEKIHFRVIWETVNQNGMFGVEFEAKSAYALSRAERFQTNKTVSPIVSSQDPLDPNRILYFKVVNASTTGMLLSTSLSNKHLFPGMELRTAILNIPEIGKTDVNLFIENSRPSTDNTILFGVSIKGASHNYSSLMAKYLSALGTTAEPDERLDKLSESNFLQKELRSHLTIKEISTPQDYEKVLKLRYLGYRNAQKIEAAKRWQDMGDGLDKEGFILGAFLGGQLVASCEFRLHKVHKIRLSNKFDFLQIPGIRSDNLAEINKLVVHPKAQNTDIVLGMFQKVHVLAMLNGRPDGIIAAEPKLIPLYERLGFKKTTFSYPHPVKKDTNLTLMIIYSEAYASADGMNPYAWSVAFSETQKFFDETGINKSRKLTVTESLHKIATPAAIEIFKIFKKKRKSTLLKNENINADLLSKSQNISDPKWTKQHFNATVILPFILESEALIGADETKKILLDFGFDAEYFKSVSNWVSIEFFDEFISKFMKYGDPYLLNKRAGYRSVTKEILGSNYFIVKHFFSPRLAFKSFEKFLPKFNKTRIYQVIESSSNHCRIRLTNPDRNLLPKHPSAKENWYAIVEAYVLALTGKSAVIRPIKSAFDGDEYCEFVVTWKNKIFSPLTLILSALGGAGTFFLGQTLISNFDNDQLFSYGSWGLVFVVITWLSIGSFGFRKKYHEMIDALDEYEKHADEKYKELQNSKSILEKLYQEGKILETINREIQSSEELTHILQTSLEFLDSKFEFRRSFIMISDESANVLKTAAVHGAQNPLQDLWKFKVDVSVQRPEGIFISSVYHSSQSILITDINEHRFHLNQASTKLVEQLNTNGFAMVPVPSENKNWGVLIADKGETKELISRRDLVVLQRVAQSIGMALDKKAKIDAEINIRKIFQKYVPSSIVEGTLGISGPKLGGQLKEATCLFLDIRNFTALSNEIPAEILCDILNQIFNIVNKNATESRGIIDKFLGDGALVTWGAIPGSESSPKDVIQTATNILKDLTWLNLKLSEKGLKPIEIGIGIHKGNVIAGNIGSQERMEFTVIGNTVNIASRLEQLTKIFKASIVISEQLIPFSDLSSDWKIQEDVQVRGLEKLVRVACLPYESTPIEKKDKIA